MPDDKKKSSFGIDWNSINKDLAPTEERIEKIDWERVHERSQTTQIPEEDYISKELDIPWYQQIFGSYGKTFVDMISSLILHIQ